jgi:Holliday junction resolvase
MRLAIVLSWSKFGTDGEYLVAIYLTSCGWNVQLSRGSRGPADIIASRGSSKWLIQVKSSRKIPSLRGRELNRLREMAKAADGLPIVATVQPKETAIAVSTEEVRSVDSNENTIQIEKGVGRRSESTAYGIFLYSLIDWTIVFP